jgi:hypothetical protein
MTLLARMDGLVYATRLDRILFRKVRPRTFRWAPLLVFVALVAGYMLMAKSVDRPDRGFFTGWLLFYGAYMAAAFLRIFGPRFVPSALHRLDERETTVKMRAYALSGILLTGLTMGGCFYLAGANMLGWWQPHSPNDWVALAFGVQATAMLLQTTIASWAEPRANLDEDD